MEEQAPSRLAKFARGVVVAAFAIALATACFMVLPLLQAISATPPPDLTMTTVDSTALPPPPPPLDEEPEKQEQKEEKPPELTDEAPPLDLAQLELALNPGVGGAEGTAGDFVIKIQGVGGGGGEGQGDDMFSLADLDQKPRAIFQQQPMLTAAMRKKLPATVYVVFAVDPSGRVEDPLVQSSTNALFDPAALAAIKQWKFEPGKRGGQAVRSRMRQQMTFQ